MIAILERTQSNVPQNIEQLQTPTMGVTINKKSTTTEPPTQNGSKLKKIKKEFLRCTGYLNPIKTLQSKIYC